MKLYYAPGACSLAPHIVLREIGGDHAIEKVDLGSKKTEAGADFYGVNSKGYVPTLETGKDGVLTEVSTILQYLADAHPSKGLIPAFGDMSRYRAMEMLNFVASEMHKGIGGLFNKAMPAEGRKIISDRLDIRLAWVDKKLGEKPYFLGDAYSVVDAYAFTVLNWGQWVGYDTKKFPNIAAYMDRVSARPAVQAALKAEGLV